MKALDRDILALAVPALGALVAEPLFLATDTALVGHLGAEPLAGLGIASTVLQTVVGLLVFLAYASTPLVARRLGAGDREGAVAAGMGGIRAALVIGVLLGAVGALTAGPVVAAFGPDAVVAAHATTYLSISMAGLPGMLVVVAATGLFRGLQDTRTPLVIAVTGFSANAALSALLIYGAGLGIAGSAIGTVIAQWGMAVACLAIAARAARRTGARWSSKRSRRGAEFRSLSLWLLLRTASLRVAIVGTTVVATGVGTTALAATQVLLTLYSLVSLALDAFAIAGQALIGHGLGASDLDRVRAVMRRLLVWAAGMSLVLGVLLAAVSPVLGVVFTGDEAVQAALAPGLLVLAVAMPIAAVVFVLDGILIGAGDARYLALTGLVNLAVFLPLLALAGAVATDAVSAVVGIQLAFCVGYLAARCATLALRARGTAWIRAGG